MHPVIPRSSSGGHAMITHHGQSQPSPFNQSILHLSLAPPFAQSLSTAHAIPFASAARARRFTAAAANTALTQQLSQPPPSGHQWIKTSASIYDSLILRRPLPIVVGAILNALVYVAFSLCGFVNSEASLLHPPSHAWISIDPARGAVSGQSDVEFRQAWVCGRWMQALDKDTLVDAVDAQNYLVSDYGAHPASHDQSPSTRVVNHDADSSTVFVHSILDNWDCSAQAIVSDTDILGNLSRALHRKSSANITLRPASVFKKFGLTKSHKPAADTIVITMLTRDGSTAGAHWDEGSVSLRDTRPQWNILRDSQPSALAKVHYLFTTSQDQLIILSLYTLGFLYAGLVMARRAILRSGLWLLGSIALEVKKNYRYADQAKLLSLALLDMGIAPLVRTLQAIAILMILLWISPAAGLSNFCRFAMLSLALDLFIFYTFFIAAFVTNLRVPELDDTKSEQQETSQPPKPTWNMKQHWSTNHILMTAGLIYFMACHFYDIRSWLTFLANINISSRIPINSLNWHSHASSYDLSPSGSLLGWLRAQEPDTLRELLQSVTTQSSSFIVKSYAPLHVFTQPDARNATLAVTDDSTSSTPISAMLPLAPFLLTLIGFHTTYYSSTETVEDEKDEQTAGRETSNSLARRLDQRHTLDIYLLTACAGRFMVSVGFDHQIWLWNLEGATPTSEQIASTDEHEISWPISLVAIDDHAEWVAICSRKGQVLLWNRRHQKFEQELSVSSNEKVIKCFFLKADTSAQRLGPHRAETLSSLLLVLDSGRMMDVDLNGKGCNTVQICEKPIKSTHLVSINRYAAPKLITVTADETIYMSANRERRWMTVPLQVAPLDNLKATQIQPLQFSMIPTLRGVASVYNEGSSELLLLDILSGVYLFYPSVVIPSLRAIHTTPQQCVYCGSIAVASFTIAYTEKTCGGRFTMKTVAIPQTFGPDYYRSRLICLRSERDVRERRCMGFSSGEESTYSMAEPGSWEASGANGVAGVRRVMTSSIVKTQRHTQSTGLWRRDVKCRSSQGGGGGGTKQYRWEAWTMTAQGEINTHELTTGLLAVSPGPVCRVGQNGIGVGLADRIVLLQFGKQLRDDDGADGATDAPTHGKLAKRRSRSGIIPR
ncbi:unnamed protein product [Clonostachys byssicola]|uniref:Sterol regulatory element-binding protein cleavage-activating protein n=1 Tax=Clonostachys byssicola TaxID=160290 RepID=A0A9N9TVR1_9HYPO|nr:unnamed protein product [Clonostachys byssicola]